MIFFDILWSSDLALNWLAVMCFGHQFRLLCFLELQMDRVHPRCRYHDIKWFKGFKRGWTRSQFDCSQPIAFLNHWTHYSFKLFFTTENTKGFLKCHSPLVHLSVSLWNIIDPFLADPSGCIPHHLYASGKSRICVYKGNATQSFEIKLWWDLISHKMVVSHWTGNKESRPWRELEWNDLQQFTVSANVEFIPSKLFFT